MKRMFIVRVRADAGGPLTYIRALAASISCITGKGFFLRLQSASIQLKKLAVILDSNPCEIFISAFTSIPGGITRETDLCRSESCPLSCQHVLQGEQPAFKSGSSCKTSLHTRLISRRSK